MDNKTKLTKGQANVVCADIMAFAMIRTGNVLPYKFQYIEELSHLFQTVFGSDYYSKGGDYDEIYRLASQRVEELYKVADRAGYPHETQYDSLVICEAEQMNEDAEEEYWKMVAEES